MLSSEPIAIAGAGSIGCFVGGLLAQGGHRVALLARPRIANDLKVNGIRITSFDGLDTSVPASTFNISDDPAILGEADIVLVTVKSADTAAMAATIAAHARMDAVIVSLQNGVDNAGTLRRLLPERQVLAGMVPFNVISPAPGRFHRATSGDIVIARGSGDVAARLTVPGLTIRASDDITGVLWGKLLVNLNNALNALSGLPLRAQLSQRAWRMLMADQMAEALRAMRAAGIHPVAATPVPSWLAPHLLRLPDMLALPLLRGALTIDPQARSSMAQDLAQGRRTEVDYLQGAIIDLARRHGRDAPLCRRITELIHEAERQGPGSPALTPRQIRGG